MLLQHILTTLANSIGTSTAKKGLRNEHEGRQLVDRIAFSALPWFTSTFRSLYDWILSIFPFWGRGGDGWGFFILVSAFMSFIANILVCSCKGNREATFNCSNYF